jgi:hypothetical protein
MSYDDYESINKEREINQAKSEITQIDAAILLASNNILSCEIHISGLKIGVSNNKKVIPVLRYCKGEIEKYLKGLPNEWE